MRLPAGFLEAAQDRDGAEVGEGHRNLLINAALLVRP